MSDNLFAELQALSQENKQSSIKECRQQLNQIVDIMEHQDFYAQQLTFFANFRQLKPSTLKQAHGFMCEEDMDINTIPEELQHDSLGFCYGGYLTFRGRFVYPVFDVKGDVMGFCGYDKFEDPKYLDSKTYGYKAKTFSCYGMEMLPTYYTNDDIVIFCEGIVCCLAMREASIQALAWLGSQVSPYVLQIMKRFGHRAIAIMDSDEAGTQLRRRLHRIAPEIRCLQSRIAKDIDDSRLKDPAFLDEIKKLKNPFYNSPMLM